jgi:hypothetical protein
MKIKPTLFALLALIILSSPAQAADPAGMSRGQTVYVPAYSHIYIGNKGTPYLLTVTLSIRNIDPEIPIRITAVKYYETQGQFLKDFITEPVTLHAFASTRYLINQRENKGGSGANFIVQWESDTACNPPVIETVMIGTQSQQGISFTSRGVPLIKRP